MASGPLDVTPLNLLVVVPVFGPVLLVPWSKLWRKPVEREVAAAQPESGG